jgi:hypothetical protein
MLYLSISLAIYLGTFSTLVHCSYIPTCNSCWLWKSFHRYAAFSIQSCRSRYAPHTCQRSFYKIFVKFINSQKNVLKIVLIIVNINKDENKSLISNQFSLKNDFHSQQELHVGMYEQCTKVEKVPK